ncbi:hypothetical protein NC651_034038 [Populus alba x Populus x berolinensis]|nr:hypothetical protein NC651_034038 [Populus alba x Populus x berolinensis]
MGKATRITQILFLISLLSKQILSQDVGEHVAARTVKQEEGHAHKVHCSRERSRAAWQAIEEYLMPFVEREQYQISSKCRLHPSNDLFRDQEEHKIHVDINEWKCGYCKKHFRAEKYLDQHFDNRHYNLLNISDGKCLADLCGALHCDFMMDSKSTKTKCNPAAVAKNRHLCESLADSCFPLNQGPSANRLHELFLHQFCDAHTCSGKRNLFPKGGKVEVFYAELFTCFPPLLICAEDNKRILPGYFNSYYDDDPPILSHCLFASKERNPRAKENLKSWKEDEAVVVRRLESLFDEEMEDEDTKMNDCKQLLTLPLKGPV